eukprot:TRINITY_DN6559_c0_g1_i3.p9 TRINITY_DN6559_c0_g1~~TRINITY_DN6559_c0_g1_i3.p9  ORF type:complete len:108 (-),score=5.38 TRINITY_DN6559_c0_g1_i3:381-704(-)
MIQVFFIALFEIIKKSSEIRDNNLSYCLCCNILLVVFVFIQKRLSVISETTVFKGKFWDEQKEEDIRICRFCFVQKRGERIKFREELFHRKIRQYIIDILIVNFQKN